MRIMKWCTSFACRLESARMNHRLVLIQSDMDLACPSFGFCHRLSILRYLEQQMNKGDNKHIHKFRYDSVSFCDRNAAHVSRLQFGKPWLDHGLSPQDQWPHVKAHMTAKFIKKKHREQISAIARIAGNIWEPVFSLSRSFSFSSSSKGPWQEVSHRSDSTDQGQRTSRTRVEICRN